MAAQSGCESTLRFYYGFRPRVKSDTLLGLWMEGVLCPENPPHPACKYITVYHEGQQSLLPDVEIPEFGPYWIPDELRS